MKKIQKDIIFILLLYMNLIFVARLIVPCYIIEGFDYFHFSFLIAAGSGIFLIYKYVFNKKSSKIGAALLIACVLSLYLYIRREWVISFGNILYMNFNQISTEVWNSKVTYFWQYKPILDVAVPVLVLILLIITSLGLYDITVFIVLILMIVLWYVVFNGIIKEKLFSYVFVSTVTIAINSHIRTLEKLVKKGVNTDVRSWQFFGYSIFLSLLISSLIVILPNNSPGKYSGTIINKIQARFNIGKGQGTGSGIKLREYGLALSGYSDSSTKLGGPIIINDEQVLKVAADRPMYLRGKAKVFYDGFKWTNKNDNMIKKEKNDLWPNLAAVTFQLYDSLNEATITPINLNTSTVLLPEYVYNLNIDGTDIYYDKNLSFQASKDITESYKVTYAHYNDDLGVISNSTYGKEYNEMDMEYDYMPNILSKYGEYLQVPDNISKRVYDLVAEITRGCNTKGEKVKKIYEYLKNNYKYSLDVSDVPKNQEFVDYFLFTEKKGYCTYFATAATIMCRIAGVPARYAEGFNMTNKKDDAGLYIVTNKNAHAWCEILIGPVTNLWSILDCVPNAEELMNQEINQNNNQDAVVNAPKNTTQNAKQNNDKADPADNINTTQNSMQLFKEQKLPIAVFTVVFLSFLTGLFLFFRRLRIIKNKSIVPLYLYYLSKIKAMGYSKPKNLADMEFAFTIENRDLREKFLGIVKAAYAERFGGKEAKDINKKEYYVFINRYVKKEKRKLR